MDNFIVMFKVVKHRSFLSRLSNKPHLISKASLAELSCIVEILHNISCIPFTNKEKRLVCKHLDIIKEISKCSRERKARSQLTQYGSGFIGVIIPAVLALLSALQR